MFVREGLGDVCECVVCGKRERTGDARDCTCQEGGVRGRSKGRR